MFVTSRTLTFPIRDPLGYLVAINLLVAIAQLGCLGFPDFAVTGPLSTKCMGYLVENNLLNLIQRTGCHEVLTDGDSLLRVVAKPSSAYRPVETKRVVHQAVLLK